MSAETYPNAYLAPRPATLPAPVLPFAAPAPEADRTPPADLPAPAPAPRPKADWMDVIRATFRNDTDRLRCEIEGRFNRAVAEMAAMADRMVRDFRHDPVAVPGLWYERARLILDFQARARAALVREAPPEAVVRMYADQAKPPGVARLAAAPGADRAALESVLAPKVSGLIAWAGGHRAVAEMVARARHATPAPDLVAAAEAAEADLDVIRANLAGLPEARARELVEPAERAAREARAALDLGASAVAAAREALGKAQASLAAMEGRARADSLNKAKGAVLGPLAADLRAMEDLAADLLKAAADRAMPTVEAAGAGDVDAWAELAALALEQPKCFPQGFGGGLAGEGADALCDTDPARWVALIREGR